LAQRVWRDAADVRGIRVIETGDAYQQEHFARGPG
jgi:hypothetical protein